MNTDHVSVTRMGTLWQMWDGEIVYPYPMSCELRERLDMPATADLSLFIGASGEVRYWDKRPGATTNAGQTARCHDFGGVTQDCILAPNGVWYELTGTHIKFIDGKWYATWHGQRNSKLALMLNTGFWAYRSFQPARWLLGNIYRRTRYAVIERLVRLDQYLYRRGWRKS